MNNTYYKIGILVFGFLFLASALWFVVFRSDSTDTVTEPLSEQKTIDQVLNDLTSDNAGTFDQGTPVREIVSQVDLVPVNVEDRWKDLLSAQVRSFVEQYGTYTNQSNFSHIARLEPQMTSRLYRYTDTYVATIKSEHPYTEGYYGITTRAFAPDFGTYTSKNSSVTVIVGTQRVESIGNTVSTFNQDVSVNMVYSNGAWLIDGVFWE